jgi:hypothetical protein
MTDEAENCHNSELDAAFKDAEQALRPVQQSALAPALAVVPNAHYTSDEREVAIYQGLCYSTHRRAWVARFLPTHPQRTTLIHSDGTYVEVLELARVLHDAGVRPSQCLLAVAAFNAHFELELKKLLSPSFGLPRPPML